MTTTINELNVLRAGIEMADGAKAANVAYWMKSQSRYNFEFHTKDAIEHLEKAAAHLGFTLSPFQPQGASKDAPPTQEADHVTAPSRCPDSGRPSLVEPAAPSELSHNFGG